MAEAGKTSTFVLHHDRCDPSTWTIETWRALANFAKHADLPTAAALARKGLVLVRSDEFVPTGGTLQQVGFVDPKNPNEIEEDVGDVQSTGGDNLFQVQRAYLGPVEWVVPVAIGDGDGNFEGWEFVLKPTEADARAYLDGVYAEAEAQAASDKADV